MDKKLMRFASFMIASVSAISSFTTGVSKLGQKVSKTTERIVEAVEYIDELYDLIGELYSSDDISKGEDTNIIDDVND